MDVEPEIPFFVRAMEPLFFGPPVSSLAGDSHGDASQFPPSPYAFQGLIRSRLLGAADPPLRLDDWSEAGRREREDLVGTPEQLPGDWQIQGPFPVEETAPRAHAEASLVPWFACPRYVFSGRVKDDCRTRVMNRYAKILRPSAQDGSAVTDRYGRVMSDVSPGPDEAWLAGCPRERTLMPAEGWLPVSDFVNVLRGLPLKEEPIPRLPSFVSAELKVGLALERDQTKTARGTMLYTRKRLQFRERSGFLGILRGSIPPRLRAAGLHSGTGRAGRGARPVAFEPATSLDADYATLRRGDHLPTDVSGDAVFWLIAATPARVASEQVPNPPIRIALPPGVQRLVVRAAIVGPPLVIGGLTMATGDSRPNHAYVPAGSAWLCEVVGGTPSNRARVLRALHNSHCLGPESEAPFGFGHTFVGIPAADEHAS